MLTIFEGSRVRRKVKHEQTNTNICGTQKHWNERREKWKMKKDREKD